MSEEVIKLLNNLIDVSPYLALIVAANIGFIFLFKAAIKSHTSLVETTIKTLTKDKEEFINTLKEAYKKK